jgi:hypothetical protein
MGSGWGKIRGKIQLDLRAFGRLLKRRNSAAFWQKGRNNAPVSTRTETDRFMGFFVY